MGDNKGEVIERELREMKKREKEAVRTDQINGSKSRGLWSTCEAFGDIEWKCFSVDDAHGITVEWPIM